MGIENEFDFLTWEEFRLKLKYWSRRQREKAVLHEATLKTAFILRRIAAALYDGKDADIIELSFVKDAPKVTNDELIESMESRRASFQERLNTMAK